MLIVLMVPLTDLSAAIVIVPVAHADVVTGGVSSAPVNFTFTSRADAVPMLTASAVAATSARTRRASKNIFMIHSWIRSRRERIRLFSPISTMLYAKKPGNQMFKCLVRAGPSVRAARSLVRRA
jgi:hypothetical protein